MSDPEGRVASTAPGIARRAGLSLEETRQALGVLEAPDPDSKSQDNEGRRIQRVDGGYIILNFKKYRAKDHSMNPEAVRKREWREKQRQEVRDTKRDNVPPCPGRSASASASPSNSDSLKEEEPSNEGKKKKDLDILGEHVLATLKIPMGDKGQTGKLLKAFGLQYMIDAVDRMAIYRRKCRENKWKEYVIGHHWRNYYEKLEYFSSNENLQAKLRDVERANTKQSNPEAARAADYSNWETLNNERIAGLRQKIKEWERHERDGDIDPLSAKQLAQWRAELKDLEGEAGTPEEVNNERAS